VFVHEVYCKIPSMDKRAAMEKMKMDEKEYKRVVKMHESWYAQAVHSLLGAMSRRLIKDHKDDSEIRKAFIVCLDEIEEEDAVKGSARCLSHAFDGTLTSAYRKKMGQDRYSFLDNTVVVTDANRDILQNTYSTSVVTKKKAKKVKKVKKVKKHRKGVKKIHRKKKRVVKHKKRHMTIDRSETRAKRSISELFGNGPEKRKVRKMDSIPSLLESRGSTVAETTKMIKNILKIAKNKDVDNIPFDFMMGRIEKLRAAQVESTGEKGYRRRMLDSVLGKEHPLKDAIQKKKTVSGELKRLLPKELQLLSDIIKQVPGIDDKGRDRFLSPRFFPLFPNAESNDRNGLLSPEVMPLYRIPSLLNATGMMPRDRNSLVSMILETSGSVDIIEEAINTVAKARDFGLGEDLTDITNLMTKTFDDLKHMFTDEQHNDMKEKEFAMATGSQLKKLYASDGVFNVTEFPFDIDEYDGWTADEKEQSLRNTVRLLADDDPGALIKRRYKRDLVPYDTVLPNGYIISFFRHSTLSPYAFSPTINKLAVLGPAVLSPSLFSPNIASPLLLSPPVISPQVGNPLILSPYVLGPNVLSAAVFNTYILSPYVLAPNVINPYVMSPLILSPFVLCPDVLSPTILSGAILSPSVLSPAIYTKNALSVSVLSPSFLS
ncbi:hypothetical protein PFISCL1PPCAC_27252, partial [Pristionchus fissidentatus]